MKATNHALLALLAAASLVAPLSAVPATAYLEPALAARLLSGEDVRTSSVGKTAALALAPKHPAVATLGSALAAEAPDVVVEAIFLWKNPAAIAQDKELAEVYNTLRAIGSLQGIEYWSASRKTMRLFYEYSSLIAGPNDQTPVKDTWLPTLPPVDETLYARQKDLSFGDNRYRIILAHGGDYATQSSVNLTGMSYGIIPVAGAGAVHVRLLVIPTDDGIIFYAVSSAKATVIPGIRGKLEASFGNRAAAVYAWFTRQMASRVH
ncbi:MAG TPA: DUF6675 family protein [bacterium]|nr:DUF6675 family protein [bacterium]